MINDQTIQELKQAREEAEALKASAKAMLEIVEKSPAYIEAADQARKAADYVLDLESHIRHEALATYVDTQEKHPRPEIEIKVFKVVDILNDVAAREWCFLNFRPALKLDTKTFEKAAKDGSIPAELATVSEEPRVQIATKL